MIKKAVYSYWEDNKKKANGGFRTKRELAMSLALSVELAKRQFETVELVTNDYGKALLVDQYQIPFDSVRTDLNQFNNKLDPDFWAYAKIFAYSLQTEPFIHIDNDVFIWDVIPFAKLHAPLLFQNREYLHDHQSYLKIIEVAKGMPKVDFDTLRAKPEFAFNCGVVGANDLEIIKKWKEIAEDYIFNKRNTEAWKEVKDKHSQNHLFEQYFISSIVKNYDIVDAVRTLLSDEFYISADTEFAYTHLWGHVKREANVVKRLTNRLFNDYPQYIERFTQPETHADIFDDIYRNELWGKGEGSGGGSSPAITFEYRAFLQDFIDKNDIKTILDFGCGDWQFMKLMDLDNIREYVGVDCVQTVINNNVDNFGSKKIKFAYADKLEQVKDKFDLLIMKDVLIHWPNDLVKQFLDECRDGRFKYVLITNSVSTNDAENNEDIKTGEFRSIDINTWPFSSKAEKAFIWDNDPKVTYLIKVS